MNSEKDIVAIINKNFPSDHWQYYFFGGRERGLEDWMTEAVENLREQIKV